MESRSCYGFIHIGLCIRLLLSVTKASKVNFTLSHIEKLGTELKDAGFQVSIAGGNDIREVSKQLREMDSDEVIGPELASDLKDTMRVFEKIVFAESQTKKIYVLPSRRFNSDYLLNNPKLLFKDEIFDKISELGCYDISSSCRCILFGEGTAAAFHILRATEEVLKQYYFHHKRTKRLKKPMWGPMTTELRNKKTNKPPEVLLNSLDMVRTSYRNPTQHPNATYDIESAQDVFGVCLDLIGKMASEI